MKKVRTKRVSYLTLFRSYSRFCTSAMYTCLPLYYRKSSKWQPSTVMQACTRRVIKCPNLSKIPAANIVLISPIVYNATFHALNFQFYEKRFETISLLSNLTLNNIQISVSLFIPLKLIIRYTKVLSMNLRF